jgi:phosphatidyl-myo-inositol dimannoside synthase
MKPNTAYDGEIDIPGASGQRIVLALVPSKGRGGGIESYARAILEALGTSGIGVLVLYLSEGDQRIDFTQKLRFVGRVLREARRSAFEGQLTIVAFIRSFGLLASVAAKVAGHGARSFVVYHGAELWNRRLLDDLQTRLSTSAPVAVSAYSAGAAARIGAAQVLHPGIPLDRFQRLAGTARMRQTSADLAVLSVFRLPDFDGKGGHFVLKACSRLRSNGRTVTLTFAGRGPVPESLMGVCRINDWVDVRESPTDSELDALYSESDIFVLATRTRSGRRLVSGEGFGIVLAEAALAGLPVVAPAFGGSSDAYIEWVSGIRPRDESVDALTNVLTWAAEHPAELQRMAANGRAWSNAYFDPRAYAARVTRVFFRDAVPSTLPLEVRPIRQ